MCPKCRFTTAGFADCANCGETVSGVNLGGGGNQRLAQEGVEAAEDDHFTDDEEEEAPSGD